MKKYINYYYKLFPNELIKIRNNFCFFIGDIKYIFIEYTGEINNLRFLNDICNKLYNKGILVDTFELTFENNLYIVIDNINYVLLKENTISTDIVPLKEILHFDDALLLPAFDVEPWNKIWSKKVDYFEEEIKDLNKEFPLLQNVFNYYIGLAENAISYLNNMKNIIVKVSLQHKRIYSKTTYGYIYNPLNFTFDYDVRDLSEYIKFNYFSGTLNINEVISVISSNRYTSDSLKLLFARLLYPSYFFDLCENILNGKSDEKELKDLIDKSNSYEDLLLDIYFTIKKQTDILPIEWLMNKD